MAPTTFDPQGFLRLAGRLLRDLKRADYDAATRFTRSSVRRYHRRATALIQALTTTR